MLTSLWPAGLGASSPWVALGVTLLAFAALWVRSLSTRDCSIVDLYWAFGFAVIAWIEFLAVPARSWAAGLLLALVTVWSFRLGRHLVRRHLASEEEDPRYAAMREKGGPGWPLASFLWVFMLQAVVMWLVASPLHVGLRAGGTIEAPALVGLGALLFLAGFLIEGAADAAIARHRADAARRGTLLTTGLFAWSRHPNYFGESLLWWGLGLVALGISGSWLALAGPLLLTLLLLKVSGIPPLEAHLSSRPGFDDYVARTSAFLPLPPRREALGRPAVKR